MSLISRLQICSSSDGSRRKRFLSFACMNYKYEAYTTNCWIELESLAWTIVLDILAWSIVLESLAWSIPLWRLYWSHEKHCLKKVPLRIVLDRTWSIKEQSSQFVFNMFLNSTWITTFVKALVILIEWVGKTYFWYPFGIFLFSIIVHLILTVPSSKKHTDLWQKWAL